ARPYESYVDSAGNEHQFADPATLRHLSRNSYVFDYQTNSAQGPVTGPKLAVAAGLKGVITQQPDPRHLFIPGCSDEESGKYFTHGHPNLDGASSYEHICVRLRLLYFKELTWDPYISEEALRSKVHRRFFGLDVPEQAAYDLIQLNEVI